LHVWDTATGKETLRFHLGNLTHNNEISSLAFTPDGKTIALGNRENTVLLRDAATGKEQARLPGKGRGIGILLFAPDGKMLAAAQEYEKGIDLWDVVTGKLIRTIPVQTGHLAFSTDGNTLAASSRGAATLWEVASGNKEAELPAGQLALSP